MMAYKDELYKHIYMWLKDQDTHHMLLDMIMATISKNSFELPQEHTNFWGSTKQSLQKLTQLQVMQDFSPTWMWQKQHDYYVHIGSRNQGITWGTNLCDKLIEATHSLWTKWNSFKHDRQVHGLREVEDRRLKAAIKIKLGTGGLKRSDKYYLTIRC